MLFHIPAKKIKFGNVEDQIEAVEAIQKAVSPTEDEANTEAEKHQETVEVIGTSHLPNKGDPEDIPENLYVPPVLPLAPETKQDRQI